MSDVVKPTWMEFLADRDISFGERCDRWEAFCSRLPGGGDPGCGLRHVFTDGLYIREFTMPAGSVILSRIHRFEHPFFVRKGRVIVVTHDDRKLYVGGDFGITFPGCQRILLNQEETVWVTVHVNPKNCQDPDELFETLTLPSPTPYPRS